jgi:cytidylate kinase
MNIVEAYLKFNKQLIFVVSGISGCGKTTMTKKLSVDLNIKYINQFDYYIKNYNNSVILSNGTTVNNWYTDDAIDWDRLNNDINKYKTDGVVISAFSLPTDKINFSIDYNIHIWITKTNCVEDRRKFLKKHKDIYGSQYKSIENDTDKLEMNKLIYPYYLESNKKMNIDERINGNDIRTKEVYDIVWDKIIDHIQQYIDKYHQNNLVTEGQINYQSSSTNLTTLTEITEDSYDTDSNTNTNTNTNTYTNTNTNTNTNTYSYHDTYYK